MHRLRSYGVESNGNLAQLRALLFNIVQCSRKGKSTCYIIRFLRLMLNAGSKLLAACHAKYAFIISLVCFLCKGELNTYGLIGVICNLYFICMFVKFPSVALGNIIIVSFRIPLLFAGGLEGKVHTARLNVHAVNILGGAFVGTVNIKGFGAGYIKCFRKCGNRKAHGKYHGTRNVFGMGAVNEAGDLMKSLGGSKTLIVTDKFLAQCGMAGRVADILAEAGIQAEIFPGAEPNPTDLNVAAGVTAYREHGCDSILSLGGGSSHDCAKGIGMVAASGGSIHDYEGVDRSTKPLMPLMAVNTTAGTASEITRFCIITDTRRKVKMAIVDWRVTPQIAINDPELMKGMPPALTAATGMDALTHAIEAYVSTDANPLTDAAAIMAIQMISHYLPKAVANGNYMKARDKMAYAQYLAGIAFNNASLGYVHAMAHQLGGVYNLPHGVCNAVLLPYVMKFNLIGNMNRFKQIAHALGVESAGVSSDRDAEAGIQAVKCMSQRLGIPKSLKELGVKPEDFIMMAENAQKDVCSVTNPRTATTEQIVEIYRQAYEGE